MNRRFMGRFVSALNLGVRAQLLSALISMLLLTSVCLSVVFYLQARSRALDQMRNGYQNLAEMVGGLSVYNIQFNKAGLKDTVTSMVQADSNLLWVEFVDASGARVATAGSLGEAPYGVLRGLAAQSGVTSLSTSKGDSIFVRVPMKVAAAPAATLGELGFESAAPPKEPEQKVIGELRVVASLAPLARLRRGYLAFGGLVLLVLLAAGSALSVAFARYFTRPLTTLASYAREVADGRLVKFEGKLERKDELGALVASFQTMSSGLSDTVREVRGAFHRVEEGLQTMRKHLGATVENTREQASASTKVDENVRSIQEAADEVGHLMEGLSALAEEVSSSVLEMIASIDEIAANTGGLNEAVNTSASTLTENVAANRQIDGSTERLNRFVEDTSVAMTQMEGSIRQIEENAGRTRQAAQTVAEEAAAGMKAIEQSQQSIEKLQESFATTSTVMKRLGVRSREVGNILSVIDEVMEQTHLLALNAAIIAAQAGDHGKPFAVVAGEIKDLAAKTSESTREISAIIDAVQREVQEAVGAAGDQSTLVDDTVIHAKEVSRVFVGIREAVRPTLEMVQEIARATAEQAKGAASIVHSTEQLRDLSHQLRQATKEQAVGSEQILDAVNRIRVLSEEMRRATSEQSAGSALIRQAMDHLTAAVSKVLIQNQAQSRAVKSVQQAMDLFTGKNKATLDNIGEVGEQVDALSRRTEEAASALARFRVEDH